MVKKRPFRIQAITIIALVAGIVLSVLAVMIAIRISSENKHTNTTHHNYEECVNAADTFMDASDYLTTQARMYVATGSRTYADNYLHEVLAEKQRDEAVKSLSEYAVGERAQKDLTNALSESNKLAQRELYAMRLMANATHLGHMPKTLADVRLSEENAKLSDEDKMSLANRMVFGDEYQDNKDRIILNVNECTQKLIEGLQDEEFASEALLNRLLTGLYTIVFLFVALLAFVTISLQSLIVLPMRAHSKRIEEDKPLEPKGSLEVQHMAASYNLMYEENHRKALLLEHEAHTDALTGLLNRGSYDRILEQNVANIALVLIDVDNFKDINDTYGHATGDEVLKYVASCISDQFRTTDYSCRVGGDEFAVVMTKMHNVSRSIVEHKLSLIASELKNTGSMLPNATLSIGVAFSGELSDDENIYRAADQALYRAKHTGRDRVCFYGD